MISSIQSASTDNESQRSDADRAMEKVEVERRWATGGKPGSALNSSAGGGLQDLGEAESMQPTPRARLDSCEVPMSSLKT